MQARIGHSPRLAHTWIHYHLLRVTWLYLYFFLLSPFISDSTINACIYKIDSPQREPRTCSRCGLACLLWSKIRVLIDGRTTSFNHFVCGPVYSPVVRFITLDMRASVAGARFRRAWAKCPHNATEYTVTWMADTFTVHALKPEPATKVLTWPPTLRCVLKTINKHDKTVILFSYSSAHVVRDFKRKSKFKLSNCTGFS